jgi:hypothetical protein
VWSKETDPWFWLLKKPQIQNREKEERRAQRQCYPINPHPSAQWGPQVPSVGEQSSFLSLPQQQVLLRKAEGWLPALWGLGVMKKKQKHNQVTCQGTLSPQEREAHLLAYRGL